MAGGGALRAASLLEYLARRCAVDLIVFREPGAPDPALAFPAQLVRHVHVVDLPRHSKRFFARAGRNLGRLLRAVPPLNDRFAGFGDSIAAFLNGRRYGLAVLEHFWCAPYWEQVAPRSGAVILDLHNVESALLASCANGESWPARCAFRRFQQACLGLERHWLPRFSLLLAASEQDARRLREISPGSRIEVYPNSIPAVPQPQTAEQDVIVFSGNLAYHPNIAAVRFFSKQVWPQLGRRWPGLVWRIVGKNADALRRHLPKDARIELVGPVDDAIRALAGAKAAVVPILSGSGTRVKILEAWAAGVPVVSTTLGAEGLPARDGEHLLLADGAAPFAGAVSSLLESGELRQNLRAAGRNLYLTSFTWEAAWKSLERLGI